MTAVFTTPTLYCRECLCILRYTINKELCRVIYEHVCNHKCQATTPNEYHLNSKVLSVFN